MSDNLGRSVKWQDGEGVQGGGWHTGRVVLSLFGEEVCERKLIVVNGKQTDLHVVMVIESHTRAIAWPQRHLLQPWPDRCPKCQGEGCEECQPLLRSVITKDDQRSLQQSVESFPLLGLPKR